MRRTFTTLLALVLMTGILFSCIGCTLGDDNSTRTITIRSDNLAKTYQFVPVVFDDAPTATSEGSTVPGLMLASASTGSGDGTGDSTGKKQTYEIVDSFQKGGKHYYALKIGVMKNVVVDDMPRIIRYTGDVNVHSSYTTSKVTSTAIEKQTSWLNERLEYDNRQAGYSWNVEVGSTWGVEVAGIGASGGFNIGAGGSEQYYSNTTTTTNSQGETVKQEVIVTESQTVEIQFDKSCPVGDYRLSHVVDADVFAIVEKDPITGAISFDVKTLPLKGLIELYEYSENGFQDIKPDKITLDLSRVGDLPVPQRVETEKKPDDGKQDPPDDVGGNENAWSPIDVKVEKKLCRLDSGYDIATTGNENDGKTDHSLYELGHITVYGCMRQENSFSVKDPGSFKIAYIFDEDPQKLPNPYKNELKVSDDEATSVRNTDIQGKRIGCGAYQVKIIRQNGMTDEGTLVKCNFMKNKSKGSVEYMLANVLNPETIARIEITVVYELYYYHSPFDRHWTNWRSDYVFDFT